MTGLPGKVAMLPLGLVSLRRLEFPHKLGICERLFGRQLEKQGVCWVETAAGLTWKLDLANPTHRWIVYGQYEGRAFFDWASRFLRPDATIVDSGANIGQVLLYLARYVPRGRILAFEPGREAADWLEECLARHTEMPVTLMRQGLGERRARLFLSPLGPEHSHGTWNQISEAQGDPVDVVSLDEFLDQRGIRHLDLWKLDVEGYEIPALSGAASLLRNRHVGAIYAELGFGNGQRIVDLLRGYGYLGHLIGRHGKLESLGLLPEHTNALFLPEN